VTDLRTLYLLAKAAVRGEFISQQLMSAITKLQPDMREETVAPLRDVRNILLFDVKPTITTVKDAVVAYSVNGQNIARSFYARCIQQAREYAPELAVPPNIEKVILQAMNRAIAMIMSFGDNDEISMIEIVPQALALVSKLSRELYATKGLTEELENFVKQTVEQVKNGKNGTDMVKMITSFAGNSLMSDSKTDDDMSADVKEGLDLVKTDKEQRAIDEAAANDKIEKISDRLKKAFEEGKLEDTVIEILHEHPVILNTLRTKFPDLEILKRQVKPKTREERLKALLKHKRAQRNKK
jgi:hypothetical protein